MQFWQIVAIGVAVLIVAGTLARWIYQRNRTRPLKVERAKTLSMSPSDRMRFLEEWRVCQARFVDDPAGAVNDADRIVSNIIGARSYALIHRRRGQSSTQELRKTFLNLRAQFDEILEGQDEFKQAS